MVDIPRVCHGEKSSIETLISEEALLFAKYLRNEKKEWKPRIGITLCSAYNKNVKTKTL
jgi:hypothetical protein